MDKFSAGFRNTGITKPPLTSLYVTFPVSDSDTVPPRQCKSPSLTHNFQITSINVDCIGIRNAPTDR